MDKQEKKRILRELRLKEKEEFIQSIPIEQNIITELLDYIDKNLETNTCANDFSFTQDFFDSKNILFSDEIKDWFKNNGGYCDCEILANVEDKFLRYGIDI